MSRYNGTIKRLIDFRGSIDSGNARLKAKITKADRLPNVRFGAEEKYITNIKNTTIFNGIVSRLDVIYKFVFAKSEIINETEAKAITANAVSVEADSQIKAGKSVPIVAHTAKGMAVNQEEKVSVYTKLVAYKRAACRYIKQLYFNRIAKLQAALGAVAKYTKVVKLERTSKAIAAESAIMESRYNKINTEFKSEASHATAKTVEAIDNKIATVHKIKVAKTGNSAVNVDNFIKLNHSAKMSSWVYPEVIDGVLYIRQAYSVAQNGTVLEVR